MLKEVFKRNQLVNAYIGVMHDSIEEECKHIRKGLEEKGPSDLLVLYAVRKLELIEEELKALSTMVFNIGLLECLCDEEKQKENEDLKLDEL